MAERGGIEGLASIGTRRGHRRCPYCRAKAMIRTSEEQTPTVKNLTMHCLNSECGAIWIDQLSPLHLLSPSQIENPEVHIPPCPEGYLRRHYRETGPPDDPDQMLMFPPESSAA